MSTEKRYTSTNIETPRVSVLALIKSLPVMAILFSSVAFAQDNIQIRYAGQGDGGWSTPGNIVGPADDACSNMGAVGKANLTFDFDFNLPNDAVVTNISAEIKAGSNAGQNIQVQLGTNASVDPPTVIGVPQVIATANVGNGACATTVNNSVGGDMTFWGLANNPDPTPTAAEINTLEWGMVFTKIETSSIKVDSICMEISYTTATGPATQEDCFASGATLTLAKDVVNDNGGNAVDTDWTLTATGPTPGVTGVEGDPAITAVTVDAGDYTLTESSVSGYNQTNLQCTGGTLNGNVLTLADGNAAVCTFTNDDVAPTITLNKNVINDNGGDAGVNDFGLTVGGAGVNSGDVTPVDANTPIALDEAGLSGYEFVSITGDAGCPASLGGTVTLDEGENITCTINNNDVAPTLTLIKSVTNDNGGDAGPDDFGISVGGAGVTSGASNPYDANTPLAIDETGLSGYAFVSITGDAKCPASLGGTVTLDEGEDVTCTITNNDIAPTITLIKNVINDNGGTAGPDDFGITVGGAGVTSGASNPYDANTPLAIDEAGLTGYSFVSITGDAKCPASLGGTVTLDEGENVTCTITNDDDAASLTVTKTIQSDNGGTATLDDFDVEVDNVEVPWANPASTTGGSEFITDQAGDYLLSETTVDGYTNGTWSCGGAPLTNGGAFDGATVTVDLGASVTCSITNQDDETALVIAKVIESDNGGTATLGDFDVSVDAVEVAWSNPAATDSGMETVETEAGTYTLSEIDFAGYSEGTWSCSDSEGDVPVTNGGAFDSADVTVELGQTVTCTITNTDDPVTLTIQKNVVNDNGGDAVATDFTVSADGPGDSDLDDQGSATSAALDAGTYALSESTLSGYTPGNWFCVVNGAGAVDSGAYDAGSVDLALGDVATCTVTNDDIAPTLTLIKSVTNDNGGTAGPDDFGISVGGGGVTSGAQNSYDANVALAIDEAGLFGYSFVSITGDAKCPGSLGGSVTLDEGENVTCTITNDDIQPLLTVTKIVINDDGGSAEVGDFDLFVSGDQVTSGVQNGFDAGAYTVSETLNDEYAASIGGDCAGDGFVTLDVGEVKECTITNDDIAPAVPVPVNNPLALLMAILGMLGLAWYFRPERIRSV